MSKRIFVEKVRVEQGKGYRCGGDGGFNPDPAGRDEGTREDLRCPNEHVDYFLGDLLGKTRYEY
jgi:hypothetical protein